MTIIESKLPELPARPPLGTARFEQAVGRLLPWRGGRLETVELSLQAARQRAPADFSDLEDALSPFLPKSARAPRLANRSAAERAIAAELKDLVLRAFDSGPMLSELLLEIQARSLPRHAQLRTSALRSERDDAGRSVQFPPPEAIAGGLDAIASAVRPLIDISPAFAAAGAMIALTSLHPFMDGNGRVSRVLFNGMLRSAGISRSYLPLYEVGLVSDGGWLLALRRAQRGDWERLMQYLGAAAEICAGIQRLPA